MKISDVSRVTSLIRGRNMKDIDCIECGAANLVDDLSFECGKCGYENGNGENLHARADRLERQVDELKSIIEDLENAIRRGNEFYDEKCSLHDALNMRDEKIDELNYQISELDPYIKLKKTIDEFCKDKK